jgi:hypothetical protein
LEELLEKVGYVVFFLIWLIPTIMRAVAKRRQQRAQQPPAQPVEPVQPRQAAPPRPAPRPPPPVVPTPVAVDREQLPATGMGPRENMLARARVARETAGDLERHAMLHKAAAARLLPAIRDDCKAPLEVLVTRLEARDRPLGAGEFQRLERDLVRLERLVGIFGLVLDQRTKVARASLLHVLDGAAQDCLLPYLVHARRLELSFQASRAVVVIDPAGDEAAPALDADDLVAAVLDESALDRPGSWSEIASQVALGWIRSIPGLAGQLAADLGLPEARSSSAQFAATGRLTIAALTAMWLPRLAADVQAALQLGSAFAAGLASTLKRIGGPEQAVRSRIGRGFQLGPTPLHLRVYVACVTLDRMGLEDEASARWEKWKKDAGEPETVVLESDRFPPLSIPLDRAYGYVAGVVEGVVTRPMSPLGGYPLGQIPGVRLDLDTARRARASAGALAAGESVVEPPRTVLAAAALAEEAAPQSESRIRRAALDSLGDVGLEDLVAARRGRAHAARPGDLRGMLSDPGFYARAVAVSAALARTRGGRVGY